MNREEKIAHVLHLLSIPQGLDPGNNPDQVSGITTARYDATGWDDVDRYTGIIGRSGRGYRRNVGPRIVNSWMKAFYDIAMAPAGIELAWKRMANNYLMLRVGDDDASALLDYVRQHVDVLHGIARPLRLAIEYDQTIAFDETRWSRVHA